MSLNELAAYKLPRANSKSIQRKLHTMRQRATKTSRRYQRRTRQQLAGWQRQQYFLTHAYGDIRQSAGRNEDVFIGLLLASLLIAYAFAYSATQLLLVSFQVVSALNDMTGVSMALLCLLAIGFIITCSLWLWSLIITWLSTAIMDGANGKQLVSWRRTMRRGLHLTSRVSLAYVLQIAMVGGGLLLTSLPGLVYAVLRYEQAGLPVVYWLINGTLIAGSLYWLAGLSLMPQVAMFESLSLSQLARRSRVLLQRRGRWFALALTGATGLSLAAAYGLSGLLQQLFSYQGDIVFYLLGIVSLVAMQLGFTALYRRRRLAKKR